MPKRETQKGVLVHGSALKILLLKCIGSAAAPDEFSSKIAARNSVRTYLNNQIKGRHLTEVATTYL